MRLPLRSFPVASSAAQGGVFGGAQSAAGISPIPFLLGDYPGAAAAYSLRYLSKPTKYSPVVKVRRSSDNAEQDFTALEIEDGSLLAWVGTTASDNGFVTTWYDQSGNDNHAAQTTAASQPKIVDAGALVTENGKAAIEFDGVAHCLRKRYIYNGETHRLIAASFTPSSQGFNRGIVLYSRSSSSNLSAIGSNMDGNLTLSSHGDLAFVGNYMYNSEFYYCLSTREMSSNDFNVYVNGNNLSVNSTDGSLHSSNGDDITIGNRSAPSESFGYKGKISFVMLSLKNRNFTEQEINLINNYMASFNI